MIINIDGNVYDPLGGASYVFEKDVIRYILDCYGEDDIIISVGAQPNSSPHLGTLVTTIVAFCLAKKMRMVDTSRSISILYEFIDTAPAIKETIDGCIYQISLSYSKIENKYMCDYMELLYLLKKLTNVSFSISKQADFNSRPETKRVIEKVIQNRTYISKKLDHKYHNLRIRVACPICGYTDKNCVNNDIDIINKTISCYCPIHGYHRTNYIIESNKLEYNSPLRNLIRGMTYTEVNEMDYGYKMMRVTGADYAGFYQEELLYKVAAHLKTNIEKMPIIFYSPLITDWSGAKMAKSLYVDKNAYVEIPEEFLNFNCLMKKYGEKGIERLVQIVDEWIEKPYKLFRVYSVYYFIRKFEDFVK